MLVTDNGGYLNLLNSSATFGLAQFEEAVTRSYLDAALDSLAQGQFFCSLRRSKDLGIAFLRFSTVVIYEIVCWWDDASSLSETLRRKLYKIRWSGFLNHSASQFFT